MLSKEQAESVSNEFVDQARANTAAAHRGSDFWFLTMGLPELRSLPPGQRQAILREAHNYFMRRWQTRVGYAIVLLLVVAIAFLFPQDLMRPGLAGFAVALGIVAFASVRAYYMRRYVRESLSSLK